MCFYQFGKNACSAKHTCVLAIGLRRSNRSCAFFCVASATHFCFWRGFREKITKVLTSGFCLILSLCISNITPLIASAAERIEGTVGSSSGTTGDCTWTLDNQGVFTIS